MKKQKINLQLEKDRIRREILEKRNNLSSEEVEKKSNLIIRKLKNYINNAQNIMIFMDMKNEVRITKLIKFYSEKNFFIPKITDSQNREMKINKYNVVMNAKNFKPKLSKITTYFDYRLSAYYTVIFTVA